ncbi:MAG TPA: T9SS type A sorting domain-containing protein [Bacteroidales bacterium]|nr:T9SS type A sorting domain-containing protein [Bacteroidales bacterium]
MFRKIIYSLLFATLIGEVFAQNIEISGNIEENTYWDYDTVWITGDVNILETAILGIAPGTTVISSGYYKINSYGCIKAFGTETDSILFTVLDTTGFNDTALYSQGGWDGIHFLPSTIEDTSVFTFCRFSYGKAVSPLNNSGGMFNIDTRNNIEFENCSFVYNLCMQSGGAIYSNSTNHVSYCLFLLNRSYFNGGAVTFHAVYIEPVINNCSFLKNIAMDHYFYNGFLVEIGQGAGVYVNTNYSPNQMPKVINNFFWANSYIPVYESCYNILIANNIIVNNWYGFMNGMSIGNQKLINNTICGNYDFAIDINNPDLIIRNNIIYDETGAWDVAVGDTIVYSGSNVANPNLSYCNIQYDLFSQNTGVINADPAFVNPLPVPDPNIFLYYIFHIENTEIPVLSFELESFDYSLMDESACVNMGIPDTTGLFLPEVDYLGEPRVFGNRIDIGAVENQWVTSVIPQAQEPKLCVFPNPAVDKIFVAGLKRNQIFYIFSSNGICVMQSKFSSSGIDIGYLPEGVYFIKTTIDQKEYNIKFVKD